MHIYRHTVSSVSNLHRQRWTPKLVFDFSGVTGLQLPLCATECGLRHGGCLTTPEAVNVKPRRVGNVENHD